MTRAVHSSGAVQVWARSGGSGEQMRPRLGFVDGVGSGDEQERRPWCILMAERSVRGSGAEVNSTAVP